jgi:hypothetical protein
VAKQIALPGLGNWIHTKLQLALGVNQNYIISILVNKKAFSMMFSQENVLFLPHRFLPRIAGVVAFFNQNRA